MAKTKEELIRDALDKIDKDYGKGTVMYLSESPRMDIEFIPTGSIGVDEAIGGGFPKGRVIEIYGPESSGKTTLTLHAIKECQELGGTAAFIDMEHAFDKEYAISLGVDVDKLLFTQPDYGEQALEITERLIRSGVIDLVVIDSVAALVPQSELEGEMGDSVTYDTPIYIRNKKTKLLEILPIKELYKGGIKFNGKRHSNKYKKTKSIEVYTHEGWKDLECVFFKRNIKEKEIIITNTVDGYVKTTPDHCLFKDNLEVKPGELFIGDLVDISLSPNINECCKIINEDIAFLLGAWCGDGHIFEKGKNYQNNRFQYTTIDYDLCDKIVNILKKYFSLSVTIKEKQEEDNREKQYFIDTTSCNILTELINSCYAPISDLKIVPKTILNNNISIQKSFIEGFYSADGSHHSEYYTRKYYNNSLPIISGIQFMLKRLGINTGIYFSENRPYQLTLTELKGKSININNSVKRIINTKHIPEHLYDIQTSSGTFVTALGNVILHNSKMGLHARLMSQALRKLTGVIGNTKTCCIFINQLREKIGVVFGNPETTTGGNALKFYASVRVDIRKSGSQVKDKEGAITANHVKVKIIKNKIAPPFRTAEFDIEFGTGISKVGEIADYGTDLGILEKSGSWFSLEGVKIAQGREQLKTFLKDNPEVAKELEVKIKQGLREGNKINQETE